MSRVGKQLIELPKNTTVEIKDGAVWVKGPKGELSRALRSEVAVNIEDNVVKVTPNEDSIFGRSIWGTTTAHIANMVKGVTEGFTKKMQIEGVGYRGEVKGTQLVMQLGYSHPVIFNIPKGITVAVEKNEFTITGSDIEAVGQFAANVRAMRPPEPYKGKGIRYQGEYVRRKQGKKNV